MFCIKKRAPVSCVIIFLLIALTIGCKEEQVTVAFTGDVMLDRGVRQSIERYGISYLFEDIHPFLADNFTSIINFECTAFMDSLHPMNKLYTFTTNPKWLAELKKNNIDIASLANNHSMDYGYAGLSQTASNLHHNGILPSGYSNRKGIHPCEPFTVTMLPRPMAVFFATPYQPDQECICAGPDTAFSKRIQLYKKANPQTVVVAYLHWGIEYSKTAANQQTEQAHQLIDSGADVIIGHHPHVVQNIECYNGKFILYSLGNFIFDASTTPTNQGILAQLTLFRNNFTVKLVPFQLIKNKPVPMNTAEGKQFMNTIATVSPTVAFNQDGYYWEVKGL
jgi:poly-gamma-glutamate capsule biosynthesis protein CapA/YwtB (metallophosphatase superfamily)